MNKKARFTCKGQKIQDLLIAINAITPVIQLIRDNKEESEEYREYLEYINTFRWINLDIVRGVVNEYENSWSTDMYLAMLILLFNKNVNESNREMTANIIFMKLINKNKERSKIPVMVFHKWERLIEYIKKNK